MRRCAGTQLDQVRAIGLCAPSPDGQFLHPAPPYRFTPGSSPRRAPASGADAGGGPGRGDRPPVVSSAEPMGSGAARHFHGLRVLDLSAFWAGILPGRFLAMMGADVIRIESPRSPDGFRYTTIKRFDEQDWWDWAPMVEALANGKRHVGLDLSESDGQRVFLRLVETADVVIENFTPRVLGQWGLDHHRLLEANPDLIVVRMPAFGLDGPWRDRPWYAQTMEMSSGMASITGFPDRAPELPNGQVDCIGGHQALIALLLALEERRRSGRGLLVECPLLAGALSIAVEQVLEWTGHGRLLERIGNRDPVLAPQGVYRCADDESDSGDARRWVAISVADEMWIALAEALDDPSWLRDERLRTSTGRHDGHDRLDAALEAWCRPRQRDAVVDELWRRGVAVARVLMPHEQDGVAQLQDRSFFEAVAHPLTGTTPQATFPVSFASVDRPWFTRPTARFGEHNREILGGVLGLSDAEIADLEVRGVVGAPAPQG